MNKLFALYGQYLIIITGSIIGAMVLAVIKLFYPTQSEYLPWQPAVMLIALLSAMWLGNAQKYNRNLLSFLWLGFIFANLTGLLGMIYLKREGYIDHLSEYTDESPWGILNFILLVSQSFAIGGLSTDRHTISSVDTETLNEHSDKNLNVIRDISNSISKNREIGVPEKIASSEKYARPSYIVAIYNLIVAILAIIIPLLIEYIKSKM